MNAASSLLCQIEAGIARVSLDGTVLSANARFAENKSIYDSSVKEMIQLAYDEVPRIPIMQPTMDVAMQKDVQGYQYWFHLQPDYRQLYKS